MKINCISKTQISQNKIFKYIFKTIFSFTENRKKYNLLDIYK